MRKSNHRKFILINIFLAINLLFLFSCGNKTNDRIIFVCSAENDLYRAMVESNGDYQRFSSAGKAVFSKRQKLKILNFTLSFPIVFRGLKQAKSKAPNGKEESLLQVSLANH